MYINLDVFKIFEFSLQRNAGMEIKEGNIHK